MLVDDKVIVENKSTVAVPAWSVVALWPGAKDPTVHLDRPSPRSI
jgi:hypothetical protein